jgi:hypothetical protein
VTPHRINIAGDGSPEVVLKTACHQIQTRPRLRVPQPDNRTRKRTRIPAEIVREPELHVLHLPFAGFPQQVMLDFVEHPQPARADRMAA